MSEGPTVQSSTPTNPKNQWTLMSLQLCYLSHHQKSHLLGVTSFSGLCSWLSILLLETKKKDEHIEEGATPVSISAAKTAPIAEKSLHSPSVTKPVTLREPIPED
ncbi:uncharacterized protein LOC126725134 [Quercus robur]|uniref:uncharacterized protein LOC126725134 n=1 Tax=Quercus robur TaxID=38942 RepID=UPI002163A422|nr:uncharacterized protein LOC126725134 [Quercus robur]